MKNTEQTSAAVAKLAARILRDVHYYFDHRTIIEIKGDLKKLAASCLTQAPDKKGKP